MKRVFALLLIIFAVCGPVQLWPVFPLPLLLAGLLWLPGRVALDLHRRAGLPARHMPVDEGPGRVALEVALGLALLIPSLLPLFLFEMQLGLATYTVAAVDLFLAALALGSRGVSDPFAKAVPAEFVVSQWRAVVAATLLLLPVVIVYAGGTVDDWWDGAFVKAYASLPTLGFQEPVLGSGRVHPRFLWNVWLSLQALLLYLHPMESGQSTESWLLQARYLAPVVCFLAMAAQMFFAASLFPLRSKAATATLWLAPLWIYSTEALPFFTRLHQDKFVACLILLPLLLGLGLRCLRASSASLLLLLSAVAAACVSVHSLVYCVGVLGLSLCAIGRLLAVARGGLRLRRARAAVVVLGVAAVPALYPLAQRVAVRLVFSAEGIGLSTPDNPVVRAHLWLGRLLWPDSPAYIVSPPAVFGPIALLAVAALWLAWRRRRDEDAAVLLALAAGPCVILFTPFVAAAAGSLWVPWMLYRLGWLVPVAALLGFCFACIQELERPLARLFCNTLFVALALALSVPSALDRLRRDMHEHPAETVKAPRGDSLQVYRFLEGSGRSGTVMAPPGFSLLLPAMSGRSVVALSERGTLVFSGDERVAYQRIADRALFYSSYASAGDRERIALRWSVSHAVFPLRRVPRGAEDRILRRFSADGFLASRHDDRRAAYMDEVLELLPASWVPVFSNPGFVVFETGIDSAARARAVLDRDSDDARGAGAHIRPLEPAWMAAFDPPAEDRALPALERAERLRMRRRALSGGRLLGATEGTPGLRVESTPAPFGLNSSSKFVWAAKTLLWEDNVSEVSLRIDLGLECEIEALQLFPYQERPLREVWEIRVGSRTLRRVAAGAVPITIQLGGLRASGVDISLRSMMSLPLALENIRLLGDSNSCDGVWPRYTERIDAAAAGYTELLDLAVSHPGNVKPALAIASRLEDRGEYADAAALLAAALARDPSVVNAWVRFGHILDSMALPEQALRVFRRALRVDSHSAWARGSLSWAYQRRGQTLAAAYYAYTASVYARDYADAYTLIAYVQRTLGLDAAAQRSLSRAIDIDPLRNWAYLVRADFAVADGERLQAQRALAEYLVISPFDQEVGEKFHRIFFSRTRSGGGP